MFFRFVYTILKYHFNQSDPLGVNSFICFLTKVCDVQSDHCFLEILTAKLTTSRISVF